MSARSSHFPLFDSLRAIAALAVVGVHGSFAAGLNENPSLYKYFVQLQVGVTIFFVISGFLLYRPFALRRLEGREGPATGAYAWRRFLRIVPAYWVALTVIALVQLEHSEVFSLKGIPLYYGFGQVYTPGTAFKGIPQAWTLCVEVGFYALLPLFALLLRRIPVRDLRGWLRTEIGGLAALFGASVLLKLVMVLEFDAITDTRYSPFMLSAPAFLDQFAIGMTLAVLSVHFGRTRRRPGALRLVERWPALAWAGALLAFWLVSTQIGVGAQADGPLTVAQFFAQHFLYAAVALGVVLPGVFGDPERSVVRRVLSNRALLFVGSVSYGTYLWHTAVFEQLKRWGFQSVADATHPVAWFVAGLAVTVLVATVSLRAIERPALRLKRFVGAQPGPPDEAVSQPAQAVRSAAAR